MKKRFFDIGLYTDALRQLRLLGLSGLLLLSFEAVLIPIGQVLSLRRIEAAGNAAFQAMEPQNMHPLLAVCFLLLAPLMTLYLFQFLNKRPACDFYHAIPNTRVSLFLSFFAAVMTWIAAAAVVSTGLSLIAYSLLRTYFSFSLTGMLVMLFNCLAASLLVAGVFAVGMCLTGTLFTNVTVSLLLLFTPRLLITVFRSTLADLLPIVSELHFAPPLDDPYNVVTNFFFGLFNGRFSQSFTFAPGGVYTLCAGLLYTGLACWLFYKRRSETAGKAAPNRAVQTVYRLLIAMIICLVPCVMISGSLLGRQTLSGDDPFLCLVFYLAALFVYFLYELFTTRKWRNLLRSIPALGILLLMNGLFIGGVALGYYSTLEIRPEAEDIKAVRLVENNTNEYFSIRTAAIRHDDPALCALMAERLQYTLDTVRRSPDTFYTLQRDGSAISKQVVIYLHGRTIYRNVLLTPQNVQELAGILGENATYQEAYLHLPESPSVAVDGLPPAQAEALYDTLREEVAALPFADWYGYLQQTHQVYFTEYASPYAYDGGDTPLALTTIRFSGSIGAEWYSTSIPIDSLLPRTSNQYMAFVNENTNAAMDMLAILRDGNWEPYDWLFLRLMQPEGGTVERYYGGDMLELLREPIAELADRLTASNALPVIQKPVLCLTLECGGNGAYTLYLSAEGLELPEALVQYGSG